MSKTNRDIAGIASEIDLGKGGSKIKSTGDGDLQFTANDGSTAANLAAKEYNAKDGHLTMRSPTNDMNVYLNSTGDGLLSSSQETLQIARTMGSDEVKLLASGGTGTFKFMSDVDLTEDSTAPTQSAGNDTTKIATTAFVSTAIANVIDGAPAALDTLKEIADSLNDNASLADFLENLIDANETHIDNAATLSGVAKDSTNLGTFTGSVIADNQAIKAALQALETNAEAIQSDVNQNESDTDAALALKAPLASPTHSR